MALDKHSGSDIYFIIIITIFIIISDSPLLSVCGPKEGRKVDNRPIIMHFLKLLPVQNFAHWTTEGELAG